MSFSIMNDPHSFDLDNVEAAAYIPTRHSGGSVMETITIEQLRDNLDEVLEKVKAGASILVADNGQPLVKLSPAEARVTATRFRKFITTPEELEAAEKELQQAFEDGRLSWEDCCLSKLGPIDLGPTDSSDLDRELYK
jgi:prevent-host-death family protein